MQNEKLLKFSQMKNNAKLQQVGGIGYIFSLPASYSCPFAKLCDSRAVLNKETGKYTIEDGKHTEFRCFAASQEVVYPSVRRQREHNFSLLRECKNDVQKMKELILLSFPKKLDIIRIHDSGDFFSKNYMQAFIEVAKIFPDIKFYAYTKSLNYWVELKDQIPSNFKLNASKGGKLDYLIEQHNLKYVEVVYSEQEAKDKGLEIDHTDKLAYAQEKSFALLIHGVQPKNSKAGEAMKKLKGNSDYNREKIKKEMKEVTLKKSVTLKKAA